MKKMMTALVALFAFVASANAMSYEQARQQALFLTDKMAYELNLTEEQYEAAYEVNLDYLMGVNTQDDLYGIYWERRNLDLSYILLDWQYRMYLDATYFYRPLYWSGGYWHFGIYARYPHRTYFYFGMPRFYSVYRGGHAWHRNGGRSWYHGRTFAPVGRPRNEHFGMHNRYQRGDYGRGHSFRNDRGPSNNGRNGNFDSRGRHYDNNSRGGNVGSSRSGNVGSSRSGNLSGNRSFGQFGGSRPSSTRTTVGSESRPSVNHQPSTGRSSEGGVPRNTFTPSRSGSSSGSSAPTRSFGGSRSGGSSMSSGSTTRSSGSMSGGSHGGGSRSGGGGGGHFGGRR